MKADDIPLGALTETDQAALDHLASRQDDMLARTIGWSKVNTGSYNTDGLKTFAPMLAEAFAETEATVELVETAPIDSVKASGEVVGFQSGPVLRATPAPMRRTKLSSPAIMTPSFKKGLSPKPPTLAAGNGTARA